MSNAQIDIEGEYGIEDGGIYIYDDKGEVVMWDSSEWIEDPSLVYVIVNVVAEALSIGTKNIRERIGK